MSKETRNKRANPEKTRLLRLGPDGDTADNSAGRLEYFNGKLLTGSDMTAEQHYFNPKRNLTEGPVSENIKTFNQLWATSRSVVKAADGFLRKSTGLSAGMYLLLMALYYEGGTMIPSKLAQKTRTRPNNITALIKKLNQLGMVHTVRDETDARVIHITLTKEAVATVEESLPEVRNFVDRIMASVDARSLTASKKMLLQIEKNAAAQK